MKKRFFVLMLSAVLMCSVLSLSFHASAELIPGPEIYAESYCVINGETGEIIMAKNPHKREYPASTTKIMTALLVLERVADLDQKLTFSASAINVDPSSSTLPPKAMVGEIMSVRDALYGMMLASANECGAMLGEFVAGSESAFAELMNERARQIGAVNTHFTNAYGIHDPEHYTTAYDLCLILQEAMKNSRFREICATPRYRIPATNKSDPREFIVSHQFLRESGNRDEAYRDVQGVTGGKTGSTPQAGKVLVTAAERDGYYTISSLMKSDAENQYPDALVLLEYAYGYLTKTKAPPIFTETGDLVEATESVRLRYSPSLNGGVFGSLAEGEIVTRAGIYGPWAKIELESGTFYCVNEFLNSLEPEKVPEPTEYVWPTERTEPTASTEAGEEPTAPAGSGETDPGEEPSGSTGAPDEPTESGSGLPEEPTESVPAKDLPGEGADDLLVLLVPVGIILVLLVVWLVIFLRTQERKENNRLMR